MIFNTKNPLFRGKKPLDNGVLCYLIKCFFCQDFLHDDQSTAIKMVMMNFSPNDKSAWQKIGAWLLHLAKELGHLSAQAVRRIADELTSVADGRYDWRIDRFMRNNGMSR